MAWSEHHRVGVDVMKVRIPWKGETVDQFITTLADQLTGLEKAWLAAAPSPDSKLRRTFALWTLKEAYTKAVGLGLGFDFQRIEFRFPSTLDLDEDQLDARWPAVMAFADGVLLEGWKFHLLDFDHDHLVAVAEEATGSSGDLAILPRTVTLEEMTALALG